MKIFSEHDYYFDCCRSFLVIAMIFTHTFEQFYMPDYNRRLTYFVTIGFVFISGFTTGAIYSGRIVEYPLRNLIKIVKRTSKLVLLFAVCNLGILLFNEERRGLLSAMELSDILSIVLLGSKKNLFGFDILIPIAVTGIFSYFFLLVLNDRFNKLYILLIMSFVIFIEAINWLNYYGIILALCGLLGCLVGRQLYLTFDWSVSLKMLQRRLPIVLSGGLIFLYYAFLLMLTQRGGVIHIGHHVLPTAIILLFVYIISVRFHLPQKNIISKISSIFSSYMLFTYLFHVLVNHLLFLVVEKDSLDMIECFALGAIILAFTLWVCQLIDFISAKSTFFSKCYAAIFKL